MRAIIEKRPSLAPAISPEGGEMEKIEAKMIEIVEKKVIIEIRIEVL